MNTGYQKFSSGWTRSCRSNADAAMQERMAAMMAYSAIMAAPEAERRTKLREFYQSVSVLLAFELGVAGEPS